GARLWQAGRFGQVGPPLRAGARVRGAFFCLDGKRFVTTAETRVQIWDTATRTPVGAPIPTPSYHSPGASPDGKTLSLATSDSQVVQLYDTATGVPVGRPLTHQAEVRSGDSSPQGDVGVTSSEDGVVQLWDRRTGEPKGEPLWRDLVCDRLAFSPDGKLLLAQGSRPGGGGTTIRLWDLAQRK